MRSIPVAIIGAVVGINFIATVISARPMPIAMRPFAKVGISRDPICAIAFPMMRIAAASSIMPSPVPTPNPLKSASFMNTPSSANKTPSDVSPFAKVGISREPSSRTGFTRSLIAIAKAINPVAPFIMVPASFERFLATLVSSAHRTPTATKPLRISSQERPANFFMADDNINTPSDIAIIPRATLLILLPPSFPSFLSRTVMNPTSSANSAVIAARAPASLLESMLASIRSDTDIMAIAAAIFRSMFT